MTPRRCSPGAVPQFDIYVGGTQPRTAAVRGLRPSTAASRGAAQARAERDLSAALDDRRARVVEFVALSSDYRFICASGSGRQPRSIEPANADGLRAEVRPNVGVCCRSGRAEAIRPGA